MKLLALVPALAALASVSATPIDDIPVYTATVLIDRTTLLCTLMAPVIEAQGHRDIKTPTDVIEKTKVRRNRFPEELLAQEPVGLQDFVTVLGGSLDAVGQRITERCPNGVQPNPKSAAFQNMTTTTRSLRGGETSRALKVVATENRQIVDSGNPRNRLDIVFMGDGYTKSDNTRFFEDVTRLTNDMFTSDTFAQYLPIFNIWAAFVPSVESGIGVNGKPRNTAFQLYREGTELRGIFSKNPDGMRDICMDRAISTKSCEFPIVLANDDFYGGALGDFITATRSPTTGTMSLRHEMGHDFGEVGEEYDGGEVYRGANSVRSIRDVTWKHWLTDPTRLVEEKAVQLFHKYTWYDLKQGPYTINFTSTGTFKRWHMQISVSGTDTDDSLSIMLDGKPLAWKSNGLKDRTFYKWGSDTSGFSAGAHQVVITAGGSFSGPIMKQLAHAVIYEYADESEFKKDDPNYIGFYPTWDNFKSKSYRPDNERCIMRNMTSTTFCKVCQENMWLKFLTRVQVIDAITVSGKKASLQLIPLAQFRLPNDKFLQSDPAVARAEKYTIQWLRDGTEVTQFRDAITADFTGQPAGKYSVRVTFSTPNIRSDPTNLTTTEKAFTLA